MLLEYFRHGYKTKESSCSSYCPGKFCPHIVGLSNSIKHDVLFLLNFDHKFIISHKQVEGIGRY